MKIGSEFCSSDDEFAIKFGSWADPGYISKACLSKLPVFSETKNVSVDLYSLFTRCDVSIALRAMFSSSRSESFVYAI